MSLTLPYTLTNGTTADANQVMADFDAIVDYCNNDLQPILGVPISIANGGTDATNAPAAITNLGGLAAANNFSDVPNPILAMTNLGALAAVNNLSDVASAATARTNLGVLAIANNLDDVANAQTSLNNLLPDQSGHAGDLLTTDGTNAKWSASTTGVEYAEFQEAEPSGSSSGTTLTLDTWSQRVLNTTVANTIPGASLNSNQVTLPVGTYLIWASAQFSSGSVTIMGCRTRIWNVTDNVLINVSGGSASYMVVNGTFVVTGGPKVIELDSYATGTGGTGGKPADDGMPEIYADIIIQKIA